MITLFAAALLMTSQDHVSDWNGFQKHAFSVDGHACFVTQPTIPAPGRPWIWRTSFPDFHAEVDTELLRHGWSVGYIECLDMLGCDASLDIMDRFFEDVTKHRGLSVRPALEAVSRGGLHAYRYAARHPERVSCIYADTPVMNLASWPLKWPGSKSELGDAMKFYGFKTEQELVAYRGNPIDLMGEIAKAKTPLRHVISLSDTVVPPEQNTLEAKRRLEAAGGAMDLVTVAEGTAESNGHHFPLPQVFESSRFIMRHSTVLPGEREYFALHDGLRNSRTKFETAKTGRVVFLGGSITFNPGWRDSVMAYLRGRFPATKFDFVAAGIPSLGSVPHAFRLERDVLAGGPVDLLFVEAAVNDHNYDGQPNAATLAARGMEGVVRHLRIANPGTDVVALQFVHDQHLASWQAGTPPYTVLAHERIAAYYGCPSVNLSLEVADRIAAKQFTWKDDFRDLHPSPYGQQLYANSITRLLDAAYAANEPAKPHRLRRPLDVRSYYRGRFGDIHAATGLFNFVLLPDWAPNDRKETRPGYVNVPALIGAVGNAAFDYEFEGSAIGLMIASGPDAHDIAFSIDGGAERTVSTRTPWSEFLHLPWALMLDDQLPQTKHKLHLRVVSGAIRIFNFLEN